MRESKGFEGIVQVLKRSVSGLGVKLKVAGLKGIQVLAIGIGVNKWV
jgi:hypothetical protein